MDFKFPNVRNDGEYNYLSQIINLCDIESKHLDLLKDAEFNIDYFRYYRTIYHEITHYIDNISTLRGLELLLYSYDSIHALQRKEEGEMWRIMRLNNCVKNIFHNDYYKVISKDVCNSDVPNWNFRTSSGFRYNRNGKIDNSAPIVFSRFEYMNEFICRMPISLEVIWECNAFATEINLLKNFLDDIEGSDRFLVELANFEKETKNYIYNSNHLEYSGATQYISKYMASGNLFFSYDVMRIISGICSNLPKKYYNNLKIPRMLSEFDRGRMKGFIRNADVGFLFLCLVFNFFESYLEWSEDYNNKNIGSVLLEKSNLPTKEEICNEVKKEMKKLIINASLLEGEYTEELNRKINNGIEIFDLRGLFNDNMNVVINKNDYSRYPIVVIDDFDSMLANKGLMFCEYEKKIKEFINACSY